MTLPESTDGIITAVHGGVAHVTFAQKPPGRRTILATATNPPDYLEVHSSVSPTTSACFILTDRHPLPRGTPVTNTGAPLAIPTGPSVQGRAFDIFGTPHDGGPPLPADSHEPLYRWQRPDLPDIIRPTEIIETGIRALDFFVPLLRGGRTGIVGGAGVGKTVILTELIRRIALKQQHQQPAAVIFAAVGERSREAAELLVDLKASGILPHATVVLGQMGENPAVRLRTAYAGATIAAHFRDALARNVLFFMDNMYRFTQAGHELATVMATIPSEDGYQATLASEMADLNQRLLSTTKANVTSFITVFVPADDFTDYGTRSAFAYLDTTITLSRDIFQAGRYPAIDVIASASAAVNPFVLGTDHYQAYIEAKQILEQARELERIVSLVGEAELSSDNQKTHRRALLIQNYLTQDLYLSEAETGHPSVYEPIKSTIATMRRIIDGELDSVTPENLRYVVRAPKARPKRPTAPTPNVPVRVSAAQHTPRPG